MLIDKTEMGDFLDIIKKAGLNSADFELREQRMHLPKLENEAEAGRVIVTYLRSGVERSYNHLQWVLDFNDDMSKEAFD
ncbi:MAG: hypothetical protein RBR20_06295 [Desulfobacterales bacterium]|jgi:hypothetical protein|nr:hypothetical protein [Desulfobacteraceae bacterium]MDD3992133.1 hypothetical protein [Desulfobacteraceae bacterium]MDY0311718.1 hypothetical protein [Desulfobacterales bacterium]